MTCVLAVIALLAVACDQVAEIGVPGDVIAAARQAGDVGTFVSAEQGVFGALAGGDISPDVDATRLVWKVVFHDADAPPCPPNARCMQSGPGTTTVYLDATTLEHVMTMFRPDDR